MDISRVLKLKFNDWVTFRDDAGKLIKGKVYDSNEVLNKSEIKQRFDGTKFIWVSIKQPSGSVALYPSTRLY